ncbi:MAG: hypothetical protein RIB86_00380, partial [Imperialibacter sp.]
MELIKRYEALLTALFFLTLFVQIVYHPAPELLLIPITIYGVLISRYVYEVRTPLISIAIVSSISWFIYPYLNARLVSFADLALAIAAGSTALTAVLTFLETKKLQRLLSKSSFWLVLILTSLMVLTLAYPWLRMRTIEVSWIKYLVVMLAGHVFINERMKDRPTLTNQLK